MNLAEHVGHNIASRQLLRSGERVLVAVSGGADSMVLLHLLHRLAPKHGWRLAVAHFNHRLRGKASDADEALVSRAAKKLKLPCIVGEWTASDRDKQIRQLGLELAARQARHAFLVEAAREHSATSIALAHHADDQAELFFLRLFRGAGGEGLAGMKWSSPGWISPEPRLIRPLLDVSKSELLAWARRHRIAFREDASNADVRHERNRIRHELIPLLARRFEPGIVQTVLRTMELTWADADCVRELAARWLAKKVRGSFDKLHVAVQRQCLRIQIEALGLRPTYELTERLRESAGRRVSAGRAIVLSRGNDGRVLREDARIHEFNSNEVRIELNAARGTHAFDGVTIKWDFREQTATFTRPAPRRGREMFDIKKVGPTVRMRHWRAGDRFQPIGLPRAAKLQDLFTNAKIPVARRRDLLVAETLDGEIFWVEGLRIGERFKLTERTRMVLDWRWKR
ncbi:MAG: tRNA lysidine(34) synthetase TilS [Verrucomicrobia bacterium]|nr:tRNA lysidine(34) synthetase TilS [Verrucomicrobiota bacterium]